MENKTDLKVVSRHLAETANTLKRIEKKIDKLLEKKEKIESLKKRKKIILEGAGILLAFELSRTALTTILKYLSAEGGELVQKEK